MEEHSRSGIMGRLTEVPSQLKWGIVGLHKTEQPVWLLFRALKLQYNKKMLPSFPIGSLPQWECVINHSKLLVSWVIQETYGAAIHCFLPKHYRRENTKKCLILETCTLCQIPICGQFNTSIFLPLSIEATGNDYGWHKTIWNQIIFIQDQMLFDKYQMTTKEITGFWWNRINYCLRRFNKGCEHDKHFKRVC